MMSDASDMLAAALEQMDGIIAGQSNLIYSTLISDRNVRKDLQGKEYYPHYPL